MSQKTIFLILFLIFSTRVYGDSSVSEDSVKAAYIFHFLDFIEWNDHLSSYYVCIPDDNGLKETAENQFKGKTVNGRNIVVLTHSQFCHVLVSDQITSTVDTLTIGPLKQGALLDFRIIHNRLKFIANVENIKKTKLKISSQLLKLAILEDS